ncbi:hypothetical protein MNBD_GAMMA03-462 [hydrothermal vent metagenome]|uniref:Uncharacterized protein n=1 Tax=hydrothermal vent metagenome TaxID=652676 RepID=A0A3B0X061_9ZZZZ
MSLWEMFVLAQVRLADNTSYDELHHKANYDALIRGVLGILLTDYSLGKTMKTRREQRYNWCKERLCYA